MGAYSPSRLETNELNNKIIKKIIEPTPKQKNLIVNIRFLYAGLIIVNEEPHLIEYNVKWEIQNVKLYFQN